MTLFTKQTNTQAYLKAGIMGFAGSGKTYTGSQLAIGLVRYARERGLEMAKRPAMFLDTETGSDWVAPMFAAAGIELHTAKTRAFTDLIVAVREAEDSGSILLIDSISHFWREIMETYAEKKGRKRGLEFQDWAWLKKEWGRFTDLYINSNVHIVMCGRAGYEYDFFENDGGKKELEKTGIKMKAETETGYEPSLLILMERSLDMGDKSVHREAHILKDRSDRLDGQTIRDPKFEDFMPHIEFLNLGGSQVGVATDRDSSELFTSDGRDKWKFTEEQREIMLDKIKSLMTKHGYSGTSKEDRVKMIALLEECCHTNSWRELETYKLDDLRMCYDAMHRKLTGKPAFAVIEEPAPQQEPPAPGKPPAGDLREPETEDIPQ